MLLLDRPANPGFLRIAPRPSASSGWDRELLTPASTLHHDVHGQLFDNPERPKHGNIAERGLASVLDPPVVFGGNKGAQRIDLAKTLQGMGVK